VALNVDRRDASFFCGHASVLHFIFVYNNYPRLIPQAILRRLSQHMLLSEWREASRIVGRCQVGCFSIDSIGFLTRSGQVTFVAQIMILVRTQSFLWLVAGGRRAWKARSRTKRILHRRHKEERT